MANAPATAIVATGRRKTSVARVRLTPGSGKLTVNDRTLEDYIGVLNLRTHALEPLVTTQNVDKYDIVVTVEGGGLSGQAGAIRLGLARALLQISAEYKTALRQKGMLTRDSRMKERKKYGQPGARKRFQFSKR